MSWQLTLLVSRMLEREEREAVVGDLLESGGRERALGDVLGLVIRRQFSLWRGWRPWLLLLSFVLPAAFLLSSDSLHVEGNVDLYSWIIRNRHDMDPLLLASLGYAVGPGVLQLTAASGLLFLKSWSCGFVLAALARPTLRIQGAVFCLFPLLLRLLFGPDTFIKLLLPLLMVVLLPSLLGMYHGSRPVASRVANTTLWVATILTAVTFRWSFSLQRPMQFMSMALLWPLCYLVFRTVINMKFLTCFLFLSLLMIPLSAQSLDELVPSRERKAAPDFTLTEAQGKSITLSAYKGKVVLLDFWATWCGGCKQEIPWYQEFDKRYRSQGLAVLGVSMDDGGMKVVKPFLAERKIQYPVVMGSEELGKKFGLTSMPLTLLIDRDGKVAVSHAGVVDRVGFENDIKKLLER